MYVCMYVCLYVYERKFIVKLSRIYREFIENLLKIYGKSIEKSLGEAHRSKKRSKKLVRDG